MMRYFAKCIAAVLSRAKRNAVSNTRRIARCVAQCALLGSTACAYYNGLYNAKADAKSAAFASRHGRDSVARVFYFSSAESAEAVLTRAPSGERRARALYYAGVSSAMAGNCDAAMPRLYEFDSTFGKSSSASDRNRATVALAACTAERDRILVRDSIVSQSLRAVRSLSALDSLVERVNHEQPNSLFARRLEEQLLLYRLLVDEGNAPVAAQYLGAEVARDSLGAPKLSYATFLGIVGQAPASLLAPKALRAAALLNDSTAPALSARILRDYPTSSVAAWMRGEDAGARVDFAQTDSVLRVQWAVSVQAYADSIAKLRSNAPKPVRPVAPPSLNTP